jgi:hypothetical protein
MGYETKPNTGSLFKNEDRRNDKSPEYSGTVDIDGKEYRIAGWVKTAKSGKKFFSLAVSPKDAARKPSFDPDALLA